MSEEELWAAYANTPDDPVVIRSLTALLSSRASEIPLDLAERSIVLQRRDLPDDPDLITAHVAALIKQDKPVPPELEEQSLRQILNRDPENSQAVIALVALYLKTGATIPPELEKQSLQIALAERPGDPGVLLALAAVEARMSGAAIAEPVLAPASENATSAPRAGAGAIIVRSIPKEPAAAAPPDAGNAGQPVDNALEQALQGALVSRPADTYLLAQLISCLLETGRITPATDVRTLLSMLPPHVQTNEAVLTALLASVCRSPKN